MSFSPFLIPSPHSGNLPSTVDVCGWHIPCSFSISPAPVKALTVCWCMCPIFLLSSLFSQSILWILTNIAFWNTDVAMPFPMTYETEFKFLLLEIRALPARPLGCNSHYSPLGILPTLTSHGTNCLFLNYLWSSWPPGLQLISNISYLLLPLNVQFFKAQEEELLQKGYLMPHTTMWLFPMPNGGKRSPDKHKTLWPYFQGRCHIRESRPFRTCDVRSANCS